MARYAVLDGDAVVNVIEADEAFGIANGYILAGDAGPGWTYDGAFHAPVVADVVPDAVTPRQARLALLGAGLLANVQTAVSGASEATQIAWEFATEIKRDSPLIAALAASLGLTDAQVDALFVAAAQIGD